MARPRRVSGESPLFWIGSSKSDLLTLPEAVKDDIGTALSVAQFGGKHPSAMPWRGEGPGVFEIVEDHRGPSSWHVPGGLHREVSGCGLRAACLSEEISKWNQNGQAGCRTDCPTASIG